jgi:hypothetical protein
MSELARRLSKDFEAYLDRSGDGIKRGASALADFLSRGANAGVADMEAALYGSRVKPGAVLTDAGYVDGEALKQGRYDSGLEPEGNFTRAMTLMGGAMSPARGSGIAAKAASIPAPAWARAASDVDIYMNPTAAELGKILRDPEGGKAMSLLGSPETGYAAWRREAAPLHEDMVDILDQLGIMKYSPEAIPDTGVATFPEEALEFMGRTKAR